MGTKSNRKKHVLELGLKWRRALHRAVSSPSAALILLFCSSFFTSHSLSRLLLRFALLPSQAGAGLCLVSCVLRKQTDAVPKPLCSTYSHEAKYLQGSIRQTQTAASKINWSVSFFFLERESDWAQKKYLKREVSGRKAADFEGMWPMFFCKLIREKRYNDPSVPLVHMVQLF